MKNDPKQITPIPPECVCNPKEWEGRYVNGICTKWKKGNVNPHWCRHCSHDKACHQPVEVWYACIGEDNQIYAVEPFPEAAQDCIYKSTHRVERVRIVRIEEE